MIATRIAPTNVQMPANNELLWISDLTNGNGYERSNECYTGIAREVPLVPCLKYNSTTPFLDNHRKNK